MDSMIVTRRITPDIFGRKRYQAESKSHFIVPPYPRRAYSRIAAQRKLLRDMRAVTRDEQTFMQSYILPIKEKLVKPYDILCQNLEYNRRLRS